MVSRKPETCTLTASLGLVLHCSASKSPFPFLQPADPDDLDDEGVEDEDEEDVVLEDLDE